MCLPALAPAAAGAAGTAAAGTAASIGSTLQTLGLIAGVAGPVVQGIQANRIAAANAEAMERQREQTRRVTSAREERSRQAFGRQIAQQRAELAARGVDLGSPSAVYLGQTAAREMSYEAQSIRSGGQARAQELSASARATRARGQQALLSGGFSAAGNFLSQAPDVWPELLK